jgi:hypothetical protein
MGKSANIGLKIPPRHDTITPDNRTVMALLRKDTLRRPGIGIGRCLQYLSEEYDSPLNTQDCFRNPGAIPSVGSVDSLFRIKQTSYQLEKRPGKIRHTQMPRAIGATGAVRRKQRDSRGMSD